VKPCPGLSKRQISIYINPAQMDVGPVATAAPATFATGLWIRNMTLIADIATAALLLLFCYC